MPEDHATGARRVFVLEDDPRIRAYLCDLLDRSRHFVLEASAGSMSEARARIDSARRSELLLVDLKLPDGHGADFIADADRWEPRPRIAVISALGDERNVLRAIEAGADGYLLKTVSEGSFENLLTALAEGEAPISPPIARHLLKRFRADREARSVEVDASLSPREQEVLQLAAKGCSSAEIGDMLSVAPSTVNTHIKHIYRKLGVNSRTEAVFEAMQAGILKLGD